MANFAPYADSTGIHMPAVQTGPALCYFPESCPLPDSFMQPSNRGLSGATGGIYPDLAF